MHLREHTTCRPRIPIFGSNRNAAFILYGGAYQGVAQYFIFNRIFPALWGEGTDFATVATKVLVDQLLLTPFLCLPAAYLVKAAVFGQPLSVGLSRYVTAAKKDLLWKYWAIWTPAQCLTFSVVPPHWRIAFIASVSFVWLILLSNIASRETSEPTALSPIALSPTLSPREASQPPGHRASRR